MMNKSLNEKLKINIKPLLNIIKPKKSYFNVLPHGIVAIKNYSLIGTVNNHQAVIIRAQISMHLQLSIGIPVTMISN